MKYIGIIGSRRRNSPNDYQLVKNAFMSIYKKGDHIISGGCPKGGDKFAEELAELFEVSIIIYKAKWHLGKHAGFLRNTDIAKRSDILIACVAKDRKGGTEDTIKKFLKTHTVKNLILV